MHTETAPSNTSNVATLFPHSVAVSRPARMSSRDIADLVGSRHDNVKRAIDRLADRGVIQLPPMEEVKGETGHIVIEYMVCKRDSFVVVAQLCPEFTAALVDRWQELDLQQAHRLPQSFADALRLAADQQEVIEQQSAQLAVAAPKAAFVDQYVEATGSMSFRQVAKLLGANDRRFRQMLLDTHVMYYLGGVLAPYQEHQAAGRFELKTGTSELNGHAFNQARFTAKGVEWIAAKWAAHTLRGDE